MLQRNEPLTSKPSDRQELAEDFEELLRRRLETKTTWQELIDRVLDGARAYLESGDKEALHTQELERTEDELSAAVDSDPDHAPPSALFALANLCWVRGVARQGTVWGVLNRREAIRLYDLALIKVPDFPRDAMPTGVRTVLDEPDLHKRRLVASHEEAVELLSSAQRTRDRVLIREGIEILRPAITAAQQGSNALPTAWHTLGVAWRLWHEVTGEKAALDEAIVALRVAASGLAGDDPQRANRYQELYAVLCARQALQNDDPSCLDVAITALRTATQALPNDDERRPGWLMGLARDLLALSRRDGAVAPIKEALRVLIEVSEASHATPVDGQQFLTLLADVYQQGGELTGDQTALDAAQAARAAAARL